MSVCLSVWHVFSLRKKRIAIGTALWIMKYSTGMFHAIGLCVRLSVFTITQEWVDVEYWNFTHVCLRPRVKWSPKMGHVHDVWHDKVKLEGLHNTYSEFIWDDRRHSVHVHRTHSCGILVDISYSSLVIINLKKVLLIQIEDCLEQSWPRSA